MVKPALVLGPAPTAVDSTVTLGSYRLEDSQVAVMFSRSAKFQIGQVVRHRVYPFRGVIFDVDPTFSNTEEWYRSIPKDVRPDKDQPFYHLLAENADTEYVAYVSEQNLEPDASDEPLRHPHVSELFEDLKNGIFRFRFLQEH